MHTNDYYLVFDIGGTTIKFGLLNAKLVLTHLGHLPTQNNQDHAIMKQLKRATTELLPQYSIIGIGVSTAGIVNRELGSISYAGPTIPNYIGTEIKKELEQAFHLPVYVENDVKAALLGEQLVGAARGSDDVYCVALGTGIGGARLHAGHLTDGFNAQSDAIGYLNYDPLTNTNWEQRASTLALEAKIKAEFSLELPAAFSAAKHGNDLILAVIDAWANEVAAGLAQIILIIDPQLMIIGGGVSKQGDFLLDLLAKSIPNFLPANFFKTKIVVAQNFNDAALYGAAYHFYK